LFEVERRKALNEMEQKINHIVLQSGYEDDFYFAWRNNYSASLKQQSLLFDQIGILRLRELREVMNSILDLEGNEINAIKPFLQSFISDTEWLEEKGIVFEPKIETEITQENLINILQTNSIIASEIRNLNKILKDKLSNQRLESPLNKIKDKKVTDGILLRMMSLMMGIKPNISVVTTLPIEEYTQKIPDINPIDLVQVIIKKLPLPDGTTPWEKIIDYRRDPDNQNNLLALRRWIRKASIQNLSRNEIEEEIEWLINEFQRHMKFHKMKANTETLEVLVKVPFEILENLVKLKLSKIPEPFFALKKRQLMLMEAEINAPGKELAYIIKSREAFQSQE
jgi:hypothetical protein